MGFKRTSEGRIFFQGADDGVNDLDSKPNVMSQQRSQVSQLQIVTLLKSLNERLKTTQVERANMRKELDRYRYVIEVLEEKAEQSEQSYKTLEKAVSKDGGVSSGRSEQAEKMARDTLSELEETRKLLFKLEEKTERTDRGITSLKSLQQEQARKMAGTSSGYAQLSKRLKDTEERQDDLGDKVEESISQQARLVRKIDKTIEDRARFMRKIERIEETVLQTRDSLNAKAMVLLTDKSNAAQVAFEDIQSSSETGTCEVKQDNSADFPTPLWGKSIQIQPVTMAMFLVSVLLAGWLISEMQNRSLPDLSQYTTQELSKAGIQQSVVSADISEEVITYVAEVEPESSQEWRIEEDTSAFSETVSSIVEKSSQIDIPDGVDDIGTVNLQSDEEMLALLDSDSDVVGTTLNTIEPGSDQIISQSYLPLSDVSPVQLEANSQDVQKTQPLKKPQELEPAVLVDKSVMVVDKKEYADFIPPEAKNIPSNLKPDLSLPDFIKGIEKQAFDNVSEAQHDLAAVYTAGHAGVKQNYKRAAFWFKRAADNGIGNAAYNLGVLNHQGLGININIDEAIRWYRQAAKLDHPEAQYNLGIAYIEGVGVMYDPVRASKYFEKAAGKGIMEAAYNLGLIYENGLLGSAKPDEALMWYKRAADQGSPESTAALEQLAKTLGIELEDVNRLVEGMSGDNNPSILQSSFELNPVRSSPVQTESSSLQYSNIDNETEDAKSIAKQEAKQIRVAQIQEYLMRLGLYPGPANGVVDPLTGDAIRSYQSLNKLSSDGMATENLLSHMLSNVTEHIIWNDEISDQGSRAQ